MKLIDLIEAKKQNNVVSFMKINKLQEKKSAIYQKYSELQS